MFDVSRCCVGLLAVGIGSVSVQAATVGGTASVGDFSPSATAAAGAFGENDAQGGGSVGETRLNGDVFGLVDGSIVWDYVGTTNENQSSGPFGNFGVDVNDGTLTFNLAQDGPFVVSLKSATFTSYYFFDASFTGVTSLDFLTVGTAKNNASSANGKGLSHASLYVPASVSDPGPTPGAVPTPGAFGAGLVLLGLGAMRRR